jgi:1-pyrroline-5-carboxylate dehydrogenase
MSEPTPFRNEPVTDFARDPAARRAQQAALDDFVPADCPLVVDGERIPTRERIVSVNPCAPARIVGRASKARPAHAERALRAAHRASAEWSKVPAARRAGTLFAAARLLRERRWEMNAALVLEVGKTWTEADADTAEAIDFCEYYGREMLRYDADQPVSPVPGERNRLRYLPIGAGVVISPWNFPCAILAGMAAAALVAGNPVVLKPASLAPVTGFKVFEVLEKAGIPPGVLHYLPCSGGEVGDLLVDHPLVRFVSFTGSKEIGIRIHERAAKVAKGQRWLKRSVIEMGGKDAIVVDEDADLEAAAAGIVQSAFGFQGQKCSACSRAVVVDPVHDRVLELVREKTLALRVGDARDPDTQVGAVVDERQMKKVLSYIAVGKREGRLVAGGRRLPGEGWFVSPTIFADVDPRARIAQEEIFGPVLAFLRARDFDDAMRIANGTEYGLTGAYYGKARIERARDEFRAGNLYLNRKCTGALVGGHPFGGFDLSGTNSKAGGPDYLRLFLESKLVSERLP